MSSTHGRLGACTAALTLSLFVAGCRGGVPLPDEVETGGAVRAPRKSKYQDGVLCYGGFRPAKRVDGDFVLLWKYAGGDLAVLVKHSHQQNT